MKKYLTPEGLGKIKKELDYLKNVKRKEIAERIRHTASHGDLSENAAYTEAKDAQGELERRIFELDSILKNSEVVVKKSQSQKVQIGSTILAETQGKRESFIITDETDSNPLQGKISYSSPLGKAFLDKKVGDICKIVTPSGEKIQYKILEIE